MHSDASALPPYTLPLFFVPAFCILSRPLHFCPLYSRPCAPALFSTLLLQSLIFSDWQQFFKREHDACTTRKCILKVRENCLAKGRHLFGSGFNQFTHCVFPLQIDNIFGALQSGKCWKIRHKSGIKQCLRRKKAKCERRVKSRHPAFPAQKIKSKCRRVRKVEKCMVVRYRISRRLKKPFNRKRARLRCKSQNKKSKA